MLLLLLLLFMLISKHYHQMDPSRIPTLLTAMGLVSVLCGCALTGSGVFTSAWVKQGSASAGLFCQVGSDGKCEYLTPELRAVHQGQL